MTPPNPPHQLLTASRRQAFTLVEIMIVVVIIGLLAAMAIPAFKSTRTRSLATRTANDMKKVGDTFSTMIFESPSMPTGIYNQNGNGTVPAGFNSSDLPKLIFNRPINPNTVLSYDLRTGTAAANEGRVVLTSTSGALDADVILRIDQILDDGNLATGEVRKTAPTQITYRTHSE